MDIEPGLKRTLAWGVIVVSVFFISCQKSPENSNRHVAIVGIPSQPIPNDWDVLKQSLIEINSLGPDKIFISGDWSYFRQQLKPELFGELNNFLQTNKSKINTVPLFTSEKNRTKFYSSRLHNIFFIVLDCNDSTENNLISRRQINWLANQKAEISSAKFSAVFLEKPFWNLNKFPGQNNWWSEVHPLLVNLNVKLVVAGYFALYKSDVKKDGIQYLQSGGASGKMSEKFQDLGNFPHYLWLSIRKENFRISPIPVNTILPDTIITNFKVKKAREASQVFLSHPTFFLPEKPPRLIKRSVSLKITNPWPFRINGELNWQKQNSDWRIYPPLVKYDLKANQAESIKFNIWKVSSNSINRDLPFINAELPPAKKYPARPLKRYLIPQRSGIIPKRKNKIIIDGKLNEWVNISPLQLDKEYLTTGIKDWDKDDLSVAIYAAWDQSGLYFGIDIKDDKLFTISEDSDIRQGDCVEFAFDCQNDKFVPGFDEDDHNIGFSFTKDGPVSWRWHGSQDQSLGRFYTSPFEIQRIPGHTIFEIKIPKSELPPLKFQKNNTFGFTIAVHDNDGSGWKGAMQWTAGLVSEIYPALFGEMTLK